MKVSNIRSILVSILLGGLGGGGEAHVVINCLITVLIRCVNNRQSNVVGWRQVHSILPLEIVQEEFLWPSICVIWNYIQSWLTEPTHRTEMQNWLTEGLGTSSLSVLCITICMVVGRVMIVWHFVILCICCWSPSEVRLVNSHGVCAIVLDVGDRSWKCGG